jgi:hypothetical protein
MRKRYSGTKAAAVVGRIDRRQPQAQIAVDELARVVEALPGAPAPGLVPQILGREFATQPALELVSDGCLGRGGGRLAGQ